MKMTILYDASVAELDLDKIDDLAEAGICRLAGTRITVPEESRALVRLVCAAFDTHLEAGATRHAVTV